jgi:hypothetical protein
MNIYAIHREGVWTTHYNVAVCSSMKVAKKCIDELNMEYKKWREKDEKICFNSAEYHNFLYSNPQPYRYRIEKLKVFKK